MTLPCSSRMRSGRPGLRPVACGHRDVHVDLETGVLVDGRQHGRRRSRDRRPAPGCRRRRRPSATSPGSSRARPAAAGSAPSIALTCASAAASAGRRLVELLLRAGAGIEQRLGALGLLLRQPEVGLPRQRAATASSPPSACCRSASISINDGAGRHAGARRDVRSGVMMPLDLRLDGRRRTRLHRADELAGALDRRRCPASPLRPPPAAAPAGRAPAGEPPPQWTAPNARQHGHGRGRPAASPVLPFASSVRHRPHASSQSEPPSILHGHGTIRSRPRPFQEIRRMRRRSLVTSLRDGCRNRRGRAGRARSGFTVQDLIAHGSARPSWPVRARTAAWPSPSAASIGRPTGGGPTSGPSMPRTVGPRCA